MRAERIGAAIGINFDGSPDEILADIRRAAEDCPWCGADLEDRNCSANCEASRRRVDRTG